MRSTFFGIEIGKTGINVSQLGLDVTGHNVSNVETRGYTRQRIITTAYEPFANIGQLAPVAQARVGGGVRIQILDQMRDAHLDRRFRIENTINSYWQNRMAGLRYVESHFDNVNEETSINFSIARFFEAMKIMAEDPVNGAPRTMLQTAGMDLVQQLNSIYDSLVDLQSSHNLAMGTNIDEINTIAEGIADLNKAIYAFEITGHRANDLRDKRNVLLDDLSLIIDIEYREEPDGRGGAFHIVEIGGKELVNHVDFNLLSTINIPNVIPGAPEVLQPIWLLPDGDPGDALVITGGELQAHLDMRDNVTNNQNRQGIPYYIEMLNQLARTLVQEINSVHREGYTDIFAPGGSRNGVNFFDDTSAWFWTNDSGATTYTMSAEGYLVDSLGNTYLDGFGQPVTDPAAAGFDRHGNDIDLSLITAQNIRLSDEVLTSAFNIAASSTRIESGADLPPGDKETLVRGNNENMNRLYALFLSKDLGEIGSFDAFATRIRFDLANTLSFARRTSDTTKVLTLAAENHRLSVSGVSLDEEMTNLIKYQHAYSGAARVITAMDEVLDRLINGTGRVGL